MIKGKHLSLLLLSALVLSACSGGKSSVFSSSISSDSSSEATTSEEGSESSSSVEETSSVSSEPLPSSSEPSSEPQSEPEPSSELSSEESEEESSLPTTSAEESSSEIEESSEDQTSEEPSSEILSSEESSPAPSSSQEPVDGTYHFYCVNDFHGSVLERDATYYEPGIAKCFGKLREFKNEDPDHTFIFSAGDMFQGSLESNYYNGALVLDAMNDLPFDAMAVGNHEFDYGPEVLLGNIGRANFPVLAGNVMTFENGLPTDKPWNDDIGISTIIERGGNKIGVIGMIGSGQTTSISSQYVQDIDFVDPEELAKAESEKLKEAGCSIVILLLHDTYKNAYFAADKTYFDGVFTGHTHQKEDRSINGVPFVQSYCNGEAISHFELRIASGKVTCVGRNVISASSSWVEDEGIAAIRDAYLDEDFKAMAERPAGTVSGTLAAKVGVPNLACKATFDILQLFEPDVILSMCNSQRAALTGDITYSDIYKATPFTNLTIIARVSGADILSEARWNNYYVGDPETYATLAEDEFYTIACTDYVLSHQNTDKTYDYFPSLNPGGGGEILKTYLTIPADFFYEYCTDYLGGVINAYDFLNTSPGFHIYS